MGHIERGHDCATLSEKPSNKRTMEMLELAPATSAEACVHELRGEGGGPAGLTLRLPVLGVRPYAVRSWNGIQTRLGRR